MVTDVAPGVPEEMDEMTGAVLSVAAVDAVELVWLPEPPPPRLRDAIGVAFAEWVVGVAEEVTVVAGGVVVVPVVLMCVSLLCFLCSTRSRISLSALSLQSLLCSIRSRMGLILFVSLVLVVAIKSPVAATCGTEMGGVRIDTMSPSVKKRTPSSRERERERERESLRERSIDGGIVEIIWEFPNIIQRFFMCHPFESSWKSPGNGQPFGSAAAAGRAKFCGRRRSFSSIPPAGRSFSEGRFEFCSAIAANRNTFVAGAARASLFALPTAPTFLAACRCTRRTHIFSIFSIRTCMKYFIYTRKSSESEDRQILSIEAQLRELKDLAEKEQLEIAASFEEAKTAKEPGRTGFAEMVARIEKGEAQGSLAWHPDRLARNSVDGGRIIYLLDTGALKNLKFPTFWFESTPQGKFMLNIAFGQSKYYVDNLSENVKRGIRQKLNRGEWPALAPVGYNNNLKTKQIEEDPMRAPLVKKACELYATGRYALRALSNVLKELGLRSHKGNVLSVSSIQRLLQNPAYYGMIHRLGELYDGAHEPIIT